MRMRLVAAVLALLALALAACGRAGGAPADPQARPPDVAVYALQDEPMVFWDPSDSFSNEIVAMNNMYETLVRYDPQADRVEPVLATSWQVSPDGRTWTFTLREGVRFHTGKPLTADAVKRSIERTIARGKGAAYIWAPVERIEAPDARTVVFHLKYPAPLDLIAASGYAAHIFDPDAADEAWFNQGQAAGTGPYRPESWKKGEQLVLTRFEDYWGGWDDPRTFDKVVFRVVPEAATRRQLLEQGEVDVTSGLPPEMVEALKGHPDLDVVVTPSFQNLLALLNTRKPPLDDVRVRQALAYAFPYEQVVQGVMRGYARAARGPVPYGMWGHGEDLSHPTQDLQRARELLAQAGHPEGGFTLVLTHAAGDDVERQAAELFQAALAQLGIRLEIRAMPWEQQWDLAKSPDPARRQDIFMMYWWPDIASPESWLRSMFHSETEIMFNLAYYSNPQVDALIDEAATLAGTDRARAAQRYVEAQRLILQDAPAIFVFDQQYVRVKRKTLGGYRDNPAYPHVVWWHETYREER